MYELLIWDFGPNNEGYLPPERHQMNIESANSLDILTKTAERYINKHGYAGAWIFLNGEAIKGFGYNGGYTPYISPDKAE